MIFRETSFKHVTCIKTSLELAELSERSNMAGARSKWEKPFKCTKNLFLGKNVGFGRKKKSPSQKPLIWPNNTQNIVYKL